ncbi:unnamed protein product [Orchesella dallaii]|uniref:Uncharacterized protein n=1 Tax=Orchesella dallaii TaxID=48710 RepID=A0ABP1RNM7_9HEXA
MENGIISKGEGVKDRIQSPCYLPLLNLEQNSMEKLRPHLTRRLKMDQPITEIQILVRIQNRTQHFAQWRFIPNHRPAWVQLQGNVWVVKARSPLHTGAAGCFITTALASQPRLVPNNKGSEFAIANGQKLSSAGTVTMTLSALPPRKYTTKVKACVMSKYCLPTFLDFILQLKIGRIFDNLI